MVSDPVETGGRSLTNNTGRPPAVTWLTGPRVSPIPWVNVRCSLMKVRVGSDPTLSSRGDSKTWRYFPSIQYRSSSTETKS
jgi:hypothetical protein